MIASIRSICLAALLAGGAAWAQQTQQDPVDTPDNPHSTKSKDKQGSNTATNADIDAAKDEVSKLKGPEFDRAFANRMSMGHKRVISMAQAWRQDCRDQDVCNLIDSLLPQLQKHAQMADQLK